MSKQLAFSSCCDIHAIFVSLVHAAALLTLSVVSVAALAQAATEQASKSPRERAMEGYREVADLHVVDCLLPGQVRRLGNRTYLTARRPVKTTASDCRTRGGEYVEFDRADYKTALNVWMPAAQGGDADAQNSVGEIFERGLGGEPNYAAALTWYRKAAAQGNTRAQFNLGTLYEQGLGVEKNQLTALNWYRQAWGIAEDDLVFASAAAREQEALRAELNKSLQQKNLQLELLRKQLQSLQEKLSASAASAEQAALEKQTLEGLIAQLEAQAAESKASIGEASRAGATDPGASVRFDAQDPGAIGGRAVAAPRAEAD